MRGAETVLVVDDEELVRRAAGRALARLGYEAVQASGAEAALAVLGERTVDAIILDVYMPGLNGHRFLAELRARELWAPVIMASGRPTVTDAVSALRTGAVVDFLTKPYTNEALASALDRALRGDRTPTPAREGARARTDEPEPTPQPSPADEAGRSVSPPGRGPSSLVAHVRERLKAGLVALPRPPGTVAAIAAAVSDPAVDDGALATVIRTDSALAIRIVGAAGADDLASAVERLGPRRLLALAVAHTKERAHRAFELAELAALSGHLARRARRTAEAVEVLSRLAGRVCPVEDRSEAEAVELGEPLLLHLVEEALLSGRPAPDLRELRLEIARHHTAFGAAVAERWGLGERLRTLIAAHHHPDPDAALRTRPDLRDRVFLHTLGRHAARRAMGSPPGGADSPTEPQCLAVLGLSRGAYDAAIDRLRPRTGTPPPQRARRAA